MKKLLLMAFLLNALNAENAMFHSETNKNIGEIVKSEEIYFGKYDGFLVDLKEGSKGALFQGLYGTLKNGISGGIATAMVSAITPFVFSAQMDTKYLRVIKKEDKDGNVSFDKVMFIEAVDGDSYSESEIKTLIDEKYPLNLENNSSKAIVSVDTNLTSSPEDNSTKE